MTARMKGGGVAARKSPAGGSSTVQAHKKMSGAKKPPSVGNKIKNVKTRTAKK